MGRVKMTDTALAPGRLVLPHSDLLMDEIGPHPLLHGHTLAVSAVLCPFLPMMQAPSALPRGPRGPYLSLMLQQ